MNCVSSEDAQETGLYRKGPRLGRMRLVNSAELFGTVQSNTPPQLSQMAGEMKERLRTVGVGHPPPPQHVKESETGRERSRI
ncbi:hypothetical protein CC80DRAFT_143871 [Byssothecium circinans]|uniref:Uncharacterized protein n=1 Tax=Byssothecium circinans TaxID=147558 RepID=A0A6A5TPN9_9PLEO|nr:hypothetical protein CC80DRAFT_143871 [Byssothecium circinans]